jgi:IS605 OrfB family transposase
MIRSVQISLGEITETKHRRLSAALSEVKSCLNWFCHNLWSYPGKLDAATLNRFSAGSLSYRHRQNCLKIALETIIATKRAAKELGKPVTCPIINGAVRLSSLVCNVEKGKSSFDYILKVSSLIPGKRIIIPFKSHTRLSYWLSKPGANLLQGATIDAKRKLAWLWVELPDEPVKVRDTLGIDIGINKLISDSKGNHHGLGIKALCEKIRRKKPGSKAKLRARRERRDYICSVTKSLPWDRLGAIVAENLKNLKRVKKKNRGKNFRKAIAPWTYREVLARLTCLAQENRVRLVLINPKNTSRRCAKCGHVAKANRQGEMFICQQCNHTADADSNAAINILKSFPGNSPQDMVAGSFAIS